MTDFTEREYRDLVRLARGRFEFLTFASAVGASAGVLWRHDIDMSMHRALALARIEHEEGVRATYFVYLHSTFYNALEPEVVDRLRDIAAIGHEIGLHFDPHFHRLAASDRAGLERMVAMERVLLEQTAGVRVNALSFHDPGDGEFASLADDRIDGLVNAYGPSIRDRFSYCSDSNGYWRFASLRETLDRHDISRLHVLTHPEWWVPEPASPRARIARAIDGRAGSTARRYDEALKTHGRKNVGE